LLKKIGSNGAVVGGVASGVVLFAGLFFAFVYKAPNNVPDTNVPAQVVAAPESVPQPVPETQTAPKADVAEIAPKVAKVAKVAVPEANVETSTETAPKVAIIEAAPKVTVPEAAPKAVKKNTDIAKQKPALKAVVPAIDVVRVDETGSSVVAGKAAPGAKVTITLAGKIVGTATADATGAFVALLDLPPSDKPRELGLQVDDAAGVRVASVDKVLVMPFKPEAKVAPKLVVAKADAAVKVIEPTPAPTPNAVNTPTPSATPAPTPSAVNTPTPSAVSTPTPTPAPSAVASSADTPTATPTPSATVVAKTAPLTLDTIVYDDLGGVVISGHGNAENSVRVYLDNKPADVQKIPDTGQWKITLADVPDGIYDLRVDSVNETGAVTERVQSPFKREAPEKVAAAGKAVASSVTIQPGYTLWAVAKNRYGAGVRYVQIFNANRDRIKDPNLIYPGQVFDLPN